MAQLVPTTVKTEPGLVVSAPTFSIAVENSYFTLIFQLNTEDAK